MTFEIKGTTKKGMKINETKGDLIFNRTKSKSCVNVFVEMLIFGMIISFRRKTIQIQMRKIQNTRE